MSLPPRTRLGPYEVAAQIDSGGMGEVYRATDTNLKRDVAIKVLPEAVAADPERLARFQREAQVLASLNHPNIAQIYGVEKSANITALVMELVEGPTLAELVSGFRLRASGLAAGTAAHQRDEAGSQYRRGLPVSDALPIARQIAEALEAAHEQGIIHRDLKPANVKVRPDGTVKVLDFGLAKAIGPEGAGTTADLTQSPTITTPAMTQAGMILGTAAYMSPEQARGKAVDRRADIWAFGCVLYEMLTGQRVFEGEDVSLTLAEVMKSEPDWSAVPALPPTVELCLRQSLKKDARHRLRDIGEMRLALEGAFESAAIAPTSAGTSPTAVWQRPRVVVLGLLTTAVLAGLAGWALRPQPHLSRVVTRFVDVLPAGSQFRTAAFPMVAVSPDGRALVYVTTDGLYLRTVDELDARGVSGTGGSLSGPFFSPDGRVLGAWNFATGQLVRLPVGGGPPVVIASVGGLRGRASWESDDTILYGRTGDGTDTGGIWRVPATGGEPERLIQDGAGEDLLDPQALPGGDVILFTSLRSVPGAEPEPRVVAQSLASGTRTTLVEGARAARYVPTGHLIYMVGLDLFGVVFDPVRLAVVGSPVPLVTNVWATTAGVVPTSQYGVSDGGVLVYVPGNAAVQEVTPVWVTREQREVPLTSAPIGAASSLRLSPDGTRVVFVVDGQVWVYYFDARQPIKLTSGGQHWSPIWTLDGRNLVFEVPRTSDAPSVFTLPADGSDSTPRAASPPGHFHPFGWSADGQLLAVRVEDPTAVVRWSLSNNVAEEIFRTASPSHAALSPDGRWLAYGSTQTGRREIWVRPYQGPGEAQRVSPAGGTDPVWSKHGRELYYLERHPEGPRLMTVAYSDAPSFAFSAPEMLFQVPYVSAGPPPYYDVAADGRFLFLKPTHAVFGSPDRAVVVQNWFEELKRLVRD